LYDKLAHGSLCLKGPILFIRKKFKASSEAGFLQKVGFYCAILDFFSRFKANFKDCQKRKPILESQFQKVNFKSNFKANFRKPILKPILRPILEIQF